MIKAGTMQPTLKRPLKLLAGGVLGACLAASQAILPAAAFDEAQKKELHEIIRNYIIENPEILLEAQQALEHKRDQQAKAKARLMLELKADLVFSSENQFEIGAKDADVTVVEFFDYNCGFCQRAMNDMVRLLEGDKKLKFVLKELPILSEASVEAHRVSVAFGRTAPEKYEEFHRRLLGSRGPKDGEKALSIAAELGADVKKLAELARDESINDGFREVNSLANDLGMSGTPSYVVGDEIIFGALGYDVLKEKIDNMRKCGSATCS